MRVGRAEVQHVAALARLRFSEEEERQLAADLSRILDYADQLAELDSEPVAPLAHGLDPTDEARKDEVMVRMTRQQALANAPSADSEHFRVPKVIE